MLCRHWPLAVFSAAKLALGNAKVGGDFALRESSLNEASNKPTGFLAVSVTHMQTAIDSSFHGAGGHYWGDYVWNRSFD